MRDPEDEEDDAEEFEPDFPDEWRDAADDEDLAPGQPQFMS